jgi:hypothetical protein
MPENCKYPELCILSDECVPCGICPHVKEKADDRLARMAYSPSSDTPETQKEWESECPTMTMKAFKMRDKCRQLEREREEARLTAAYWRDIAAGKFAEAAVLPWEFPERRCAGAWPGAPLRSSQNSLII